MKLQASLVLAIAAFALSACSTAGRVGPPSPSDEEAIRKGEKAVVLLRTRVDGGKTPVDVSRSLFLPIAGMSRAEPLQRVPARPAPGGEHSSTPSEDTRRADWEYLILRTGETYYLERHLAGPPPPTRMWFHVPRGKQLVYIGSLSLPCGSGSPERDSRCDPLIGDETDTARKVARDRFPSYGEVAISLMRPWPVIPDPESEPVLNPGSSFSLAVSATKTLVAPDWYSRAFERTLNPPEDMERGLARASEHGAGPFLMLGYLAYLPAGAVMGLVGGAHSSTKWQPCVDSLSAELHSYDYAKEIQVTAASALHAKGMNGGVKIPAQTPTEQAGHEKSKLILQIDLSRITLSECLERWKFSVNTAIHASLLAADTDDYLYDRVFKTSNAIQWRPLHQYRDDYQVPISVSFPCRKIEEYCNEGGSIIFRQQVVSAVNAAVQKIVEDLTPQTKKGEMDAAFIEPAAP